MKMEDTGSSELDETISSTRGVVYMLREKSWPIEKYRTIGKIKVGLQKPTTKKPRECGYGSKTEVQIIRKVYVDDFEEAEEQLKKEFPKNFRRIKGDEYFYGQFRRAGLLFDSTVKDYNPVKAKTTYPYFDYLTWGTWLLSPLEGEHLYDPKTFDKKIYSWEEEIIGGPTTPSGWKIITIIGLIVGGLGAIVYGSKKDKKVIQNNTE